MNWPVARALSFRHLTRHPVQLLFALGGIALGVAVVIGIDISIDSARRAFDVAAEGVGGNATHRIVAGTGGLPEEVFRTVRVDLSVDDAAPVIERTVVVRARRENASKSVFTLLGIDPYSEAGFRFGSGGGGGFNRLATAPDSALLSADAAGRLGVTTGDFLEVRAGTERVELEIAGVIETDSDVAKERLAQILVVDIATAQERFGTLGRIDRIDLRLSSDEELLQVRSALPGRVAIEPASKRRQELDRMTSAFQLNLRSLSLLALVVGLFLVHNTMAFGVVTRRGLVARLRAFGATRRSIVGVLLGESLVIGIVGSGIGLLLGSLLGRGLVDVVSRTIGDLYLHVEVSSVEISGASVLRATLLGIGVSVLAAIRPAFEASRADPRLALHRSTIEGRSARASAARFLVAALLAASAWVVIGWPTRSLLAGYAAMGLVLAATVTLAPLVVRGTTAIASSIAGRASVVVRWSIRSVPAHESRTGLAIAALAVAISMTVGVGVMIESFRNTVVTWLDTTLAADVYVGVRGVVARRGSQRTLPDELVQEIRRLEGIDAIADGRIIEAPIRFPSGEAGAERPPRLEIILRGGDFERLRFDGVDEAGLREWRAGQIAPAANDVVIASEPCARRYGLEVGDALTFTTDTGPVDFTIVGIGRDFASDLGFVWMPRPVAERHWESARGSGSLAIFVEEGVDPKTVEAQIEDLVTRTQDGTGSEGVVLSTVDGLRRATLEIFDRTFAITRVLELLATVVAALGVFGSLVALVVDRRREVAIWRSHGLTRRELFRALIVQSGAIGAHAAVIAIPLGIAFAVLLVRIVHERSFGWSIDLQLSWTLVVEAFAIGIVSAVLGGLAPLSRLAGTRVVPALRRIEV